MSNGLNNQRGREQASFGPAASLAPLFRPPSHAEVVATVVSEVLGGRAIVAVRGDAGVGKTALVQSTASALRSHSRTVATIDAGAADPRSMLQRLGQILRIDEAGQLEADALLTRLRTWEGVQRLVLVIDDADLLSTAMFRTLSLLIKLFDLRPATLQIVLVGRSGQWPGVQPPDLETMRRATLSLHTIASPPVEADVEPEAGTRSRPMAGLFLARTSGKSRNRMVIAALGLLMTGIATAELIDVSDALAPGPDVAPAADVRPGPPPTSDSSADTASGAVPRTSDPEGAPSAAPKLTPLPAPAPPETRTVEGAAPIPEDAQAELAFPIPGSRGGPGLVLVAGAGDNLPALYAKIYRGVTPPPYRQVVAANPLPMKPGALVIFPEPPAGWPLR